MIGCETGLQILWRGGRPVKAAARKNQWNSDGALNTENSIESKDEADPTLYREGAGFVDGGADHDSSASFESIIQFINLPFGVAVLHLAFPYIPMDALQQDQNALPSLLTGKLVAAVVCSDSSVRLVVLPLAPPSTRAKRKAETADKPLLTNGQSGPYGEQVLVVSGGDKLRGASQRVSLTLALAPVDADSDLETYDGDIQSGRNPYTGRRRLISQTRSRSRSRSLAKGEGWDILVASCSSDASGPLLLHRVPLSPSGSEMDLTSAEHGAPWNIQHLPSSVASLHFNPSLPGDERHGRLLVAEMKGTVRVLDCLATGTSSCLVSLYPSLKDSVSGRGIRKHSLDAQWVLGGKALLALFDDGKWGIWDLEGYGPKAQSGALTPTIPTMGSFFAFAVDGLVNGGSNGLKASDANAQTKEGLKAVKLAPTTPSTRRARQENLFSGPHRHTEGPAQGGISVIPADDARTVDEAVLLWHNDSVMVIPSLRTHWVNKVKGSGNLFGNEAKGEARLLRNVSLRGERRTCVSLLPASYESIYEDSLGFPVLVTGETRFVVVTTSPISGQRTTSTDLEGPRSDQRLLEQGELDLDGMDRVLTNMNDKSQTEKLTTRGVALKRKEGFLTYDSNS